MNISDDKLPLSPMRACLDNYRRDDVPPDGAVVEVCAEDHHGVYAIPFPVRFQDDTWFNAATGQELAGSVYIAGWRERKFG